MPNLPGADYLLDACALLAYFRREEGRDVVRGLIDRAERGEIRLFMNVINQVEVFYDRIRSEGIERATEEFARVDVLPITIIGAIERSEAEQAARLKATGGMSLADTFLVASAMRTGATLVTSDWNELEPVADKGLVPFLWIRPRPEEPGITACAGLKTLRIDEFSAAYITAKALSARQTPAEIVHALVTDAIIASA